jgi:hypothetical protein
MGIIPEAAAHEIVRNAHVNYLDLGAVRGIDFVSNCDEVLTKACTMALILVKPV